MAVGLFVLVGVYLSLYNHKLRNPDVKSCRSESQILSQFLPISNLFSVEPLLFFCPESNSSSQCLPCREIIIQTGIGPDLLSFVKSWKARKNLNILLSSYTYFVPPSFDRKIRVLAVRQSDTLERDADGHLLMALLQFVSNFRYMAIFSGST